MYIFYDTETTGTDIAFDQILQFAAVLTDKDFTVLDELNVRCQCLPWIVPAPGALAVTNTDPHQLSNPALPSFYKMMESIRSTLTRWSPATFIGYNSLRFDEPLLQRALWQSLFPPYLTVTNGNCRLDLLPLIRCAALISGNKLKIPNNELGKPTFRLDRLAPENGFAHKNAHDAFGDVEATIFLAKTLSANLPPFWDLMVNRSSKPATNKAMPPFEPILIMDGQYSSTKPWWGTRIDNHGISSSHAVVAKLDFNWNKFDTLDLEVQSTDLPIQQLPFKRIALNKAPIFFSQSEAAYFLNSSIPNRLNENLNRLKKSDELISHLLDRAKFPEATPVPQRQLEETIYDGFPSTKDTQLMEEFHSARDSEKYSVANEFSDQRFRLLAKRICFVDYPDCMPKTEINNIKRAIDARIRSTDASLTYWRTIDIALEELDLLIAQANYDPKLVELKSWLKGRNTG